jgi:hypothetical protein
MKNTILPGIMIHPGQSCRTHFRPSVRRYAVLTGLLLAGVQASADMVSYSFSTGPVSATTFGAGSSGSPGRVEIDQYLIGYDSKVFPKFDPSLGTLQDIQLTLNLAVTNTASFSYSGAGQSPQPPGSGSHGLFFSWFSVSDTHNFSYLSANSPDVSSGQGGGGFSVPVGSTVFDTASLWGSLSKTISDPTTLSKFTGANDALSLYFEVRAYETSIGNNADPNPGGGISQLDYSLAYDFVPTPTPEPGQLGLVLLGAGVMLAVRKRKV